MILILFGPSCAPLLRQYDRDITDIVQRLLALMYPVISSATVGLQGLKATVRAFRQMLRQILQRSPISKFTRARHRQDIRVAFALNGLKGLSCRKSRIRFDDHATCPTRWDKLSEHPAKQDVLLPFPVRVNESAGNRHPEVIPTGNQQHHLKAEREAGVLVHAAFAPERVFLTTFPLKCRVTDQMQGGILGRRQKAQGVGAQLFNQCSFIPPAASDHPQQRPVSNPFRHQARQLLKVASTLIEREHDNQPAEEPKMPTLRATEMMLVSEEKKVYLLGDTCKAKHVALSEYWTVRTFQHIRERASFQRSALPVTFE